MKTFTCFTCGLSDAMVPEDSGLTYMSWHCTRCNLSRTQKTLLGRALVFASLALLVFGLTAGDRFSPDCCGGGG
jgi:hypothetical protein